MGIRTLLGSAKVWAADRGWSVTVDHDYRPTRRYKLFSVIACKVYGGREDYVGVHASLLGLHVNVTKYARPQG
jgi:hypothetical protein